MGSCNLGSSRLSWLQSQKEVLVHLDFSNASIFGSIPYSFGNLFLIYHGQVLLDYMRKICESKSGQGIIEATIKMK